MNCVSKVATIIFELFLARHNVWMQYTTVSCDDCPIYLWFLYTRMVQNQQGVESEMVPYTRPWAGVITFTDQPWTFWAVTKPQ